MPSLTAGTVLDSTKLRLRTWFLANYLVSELKTGLSSLALKRPIGYDDLPHRLAGAPELMVTMLD